MSKIFPLVFFSYSFNPIVQLSLGQKI